MKKLAIHILLIIFIILSCSNEDVQQYAPTPSLLKIPELFENNILKPVIPSDNQQTVEGIELGKKLFFDPILSGDKTLACADCHAPENAFTDSSRFSEGIDGSLGKRNSMPLFNLAWNYDENFFWDGGTFSLEHQAFIPVSDPTEMKNSWKQLQQELQKHPEYPNLFQKAFGTSKIDSTLVTKAIAQFERTLISANSKFDKYLLGEVILTPEEVDGFNIFMEETKGDCFHCHGSDKNPLWTDNIFHNNGLDETFTDLGLGTITGDPADNGKFKSPSLRNLIFTAPYMHDGRFTTIDEVINHYSEGLKNSSTIDPLMKKVAQGGVGLSIQEKSNLKAFLLALSDYDFIGNPDFIND
ncbi:MAG: cytochrome-c peroxidase [Flaviramulus sp.]|nr:cytochrome-c peroxidase [Flaviramulus sp.]